MAGKRKGTKMSLTDFLADQSTGSWADEMEDLPSAPAAAYSDSADHESGHSRGGFNERGRGSFSRSYSRDSRYDSRDSPRDSRFPGRVDRAPQPLPSSPPFTAHLGNLPYDLTEKDVVEFFSESRISNIRILRDKDDRPKGFGYVEFEDLPSLKKALDLSNESLRGRPVKISVAEPPREREPREDRTAGEWRRARRESPSSSPKIDRFGSGDRFGHREDRWNDRGELREPREPRERSIRGDRSPRGERADGSPRGDQSERDRQERGNFHSRGDRSAERPDRNKSDTEWKGGAFSSRTNNFRERKTEDRFGSSNTSPPPQPMRKKLELKPRSVSTPQESSTAYNSTKPLSPTPTQILRSKPNPFGDAKPIDSDEALRRVEERRKQRDREEKEKAEKEAVRRENEAKDSVSENVILGAENGNH